MKYYKDAFKSTFLTLVVLTIAVFLTPHINHTAMNQPTYKAIPSIPTTKAQPQHITTEVVEIRDLFDEEVLKSSVPVVVDFYAEWCPSCNAIKPIYNELAACDTFKGKVKFVSVNIEKSKKDALMYSVNAIPTIYFFNQGKQIGSASVGFVSKEKLTDLIQERFSL